MRVGTYAQGLFSLLFTSCSLAYELHERAACNRDNCLRALVRSSSLAAPFCSTFTKSPAPSTLPSFATACTGNQASRITSACSCLEKEGSSTSKVLPSAPATSVAPSSASTTIVPSSSPTCLPSLLPVGVSEDRFNRKNTDFSFEISCSELDIKNVTAFANYQVVEGITVTSKAISFAGFTDDYVLLTLLALDVTGTPFFKSYQLLFGSIDMPVLVLGPDGQPAANVFVQANATIYPGVGQSGYTDASGKYTFQNLISTTVSLVAKTADNSIAVDGLAASAGQVTMKLMPFASAKDGETFDVDNGLTGWKGGVTSQTAKVKRDLTLVVSTNGQSGLQTAGHSFLVHPFTKTAYIKYKFVTSEVPGGYFGSKFNDYYSITIRSDTGAYVSATNSMNALGLGAFDYNSGSTAEFTLTLSVPANTKSVSYDVGVANVGDSAYDSSVIVTKVGDLQCDKCGDCSTCPADPMCQSTCINPPLKSCNFYRDCAEGQLGCGAGGYPLQFGERKCHDFMNNLAHFSAEGQQWVFDTMHCLQLELVPLLKPCTATCGSMSKAAFDSHPKCYVQAGVCGLGCVDAFWILMTVGSDVWMKESVDQVGGTMYGCIQNIIETLSGCTGEAAGAVLIGRFILIKFLKALVAAA
ncbi:hypothetical protein H2201_008608 [Coniosporium apollinis]|uniref:Carboxypeptidase regulatory-like domain-containing protein n=1 Tax=Coniosporium apollinis TaxID=61459 RepID=A0ABQ9NI77_9PEZI|nr:hypothetical protein H2201_008608 [Coniosporium apollinis]